MAVVSNNSAGGRPITADASLRRNDALPLALRRVLNAAPHRMHPSNGEDLLPLYRCDPAAARAALVRSIANICAGLTRKTYGPDHPCVARFQAIAERGL